MTKIRHVMAVSLQLPTILSSHVDPRQEAFDLKNTTMDGRFGHLHIKTIKYYNQAYLCIFKKVFSNAFFK